MAQSLLEICCQADCFFREGFDAVGRRSICPKVKLLMGLKLLAYGVSASAFVDYFQMGVSTGRLCFQKLCQSISGSDLLCGKYKRCMNRSDAHRVTALHLSHHGVDGMLGSLDCMHVGWKNCPVAWQGAFQGKEKSPTIVLEAVSDYNLWIWHAAFGFAGSLNDINIWEQSPLLKMFVDGTFSKEVDFEFQIAGKVFHRCWYLVDGIYPEIARFAKTIDEPVGRGKKLYAIWQEASRKDVERAFGVLRQKFMILKREVEQWFLGDIRRIVDTSIILHNMMVEHRVDRGEKEDISYYEVVEDELINNLAIDVDEEQVNRNNAEIMLQYNLESQYYTGSSINREAIENIDLTRRLGVEQQVASRRWSVLYDRTNHYQLQEAIINQLIINEDNFNNLNKI
jgi:hypothetical protein